MKGFVSVVRIKDYDGSVHGIIAICRDEEKAKEVIAEIQVILDKHEVRRNLIIEYHPLLEGLKHECCSCKSIKKSK